MATKESYVKKNIKYIIYNPLLIIQRKSKDPDLLLASIQKMLYSNYKIKHNTTQIELDDNDYNCHY